jgi:hypothetical protein
MKSLAYVLILTAAACGQTVAPPGQPDGPPGTPDADPSAPDADPSAPDASPGTPDARPGVPDAGVACGGGAVCGPTEYCEYGTNRCGTDGAIGVCTPRPFGCPDFYYPTCGCDGTIYGNDCDAAAAGVDVSNLGNCEPPKGQWACGEHFCNRGADYCQRAVSDIGGWPDSYGCYPLPTSCPDPATCDCLSGEPCWSFGCEAAGPGELTITCPGG